MIPPPFRVRKRAGARKNYAIQMACKFSAAPLAFMPIIQTTRYTLMSKENLPSYLAEVKPNPESNRAPWYKNTAPAYAGIILWFVFWQNMVNHQALGGGLSHGILYPIIGVVVGAMLCYCFFYKIPAMFGMKTGLPLYVIGSSIFGTKGGIVMPGLLMGLLQFGWVGVNIFGSSWLIAKCIAGDAAPSDALVWGIMAVWGVAATLMGLVGIKYVAKISTYLPLIPLVILLVLIIKTIGTVGDFNSESFMELAKAKEAAKAAAAGSAPGLAELTPFGVVATIITIIVGFYATAGAAGTDFGTAARNESDVRLGGIVGVSIAMIFTGVAAVIIVAGAYGNPETAMSLAGHGMPMDVTIVMNSVMGSGAGRVCMLLLALAAFPAACFSAMIAANSFKTMLPNVNANLSVSIGGIVAIILAVTGIAGDAVVVFGFIGASFGPICGAMYIDYFANGKKWSGPREGVNPAGWLAWAVGFIVGVLPNFGVNIPMSPVAAFLAGAIVYAACVKTGLQSKLVELK